MTKDKSGFYRYSLKDGISLFVYPTRKFKSLLAQAYMHRHLRPGEAARLSLYCIMLERGTRKLPGIDHISKFLDELYGASFGTGISRRGDRQILNLRLGLLGERYLPVKEKILAKAVDFARDVLVDPYLVEDAYPESNIAQEKTNLKNIILCLEDDRRSYAFEQCIRHCCKNEPFSVPKYGSIEDMPSIGNKELVEFGRRVIAESPMDIYVAGDVNPKHICDLMRGSIDWPRKKVINIKDDILREASKKVRYVTEKKKVEQTVLVLAYRTKNKLSEKLFYPALFMNGVLGGFSHSKLFQNIREKEGLAYYSYSTIELSKGLLFVVCGIDKNKKEQASAIAREQVSAVLRGELNDFEMESTRRGLVSRVMDTEDSLSDIVDMHFGRNLIGRSESLPEIIKEYQKVKSGQIADVMSGFRLDTEYVLTSE